MDRASLSSSGAVVHLEVRLGNSRPTVYEVGAGGMLVGSVPGCDLRLPGTNLPPVVCVIGREPGGATLRRLAPVLPILINGRPATSAPLVDGDVIVIGSVEMVVRLSGGAEEPATASQPDDRLLAQQKQEFEVARVLWNRKREELEGQIQQLTRRLEEATRAGPQTLPPFREDIARRLTELETRQRELTRQREELDGVRAELEHLRGELTRRYQQRRQRVVARQQAIRKAAQKLRQRMTTLEERENRLAPLEEEIRQKCEEADALREQAGRERQLIEEQHRLFASRQQEIQRDLHTRFKELEEREAALREERVQLDKGQKQHQSDLVRLDRMQASIEQRQKQLAERAKEIDRRFEQLQRDTRDLEEQATQLDEWHNRLTAQAAAFDQRKIEQDTYGHQLEQRASALEGQQAMLATLRTRLERMREELRRQEQALGEQRELQEQGEADLKAKLDEAERLRSDLANDRQLFDEERRRFEERRETLDQAVARMRQAQEALSREQEELRSRKEEIEATAAEQQEQAGMLLTRGEQLQQLGLKLQQERQSHRDREATLAKAEQTLAALQEHVRKRVEDLDNREKDLASREEQLSLKSGEVESRLSETEKRHQETSEQLDQLRQQLEAQARALEVRSGELAKQADDLKLARESQSDAQQSLASQRQGLAAERVAFELERQAAQEQQRQTREEFSRARDEAQTLARALPELELRANAALDRLTRGREQLREHLSEVHTYARQSREDLEGARKQIQSEAEKLRQQELELEVVRDEHRLAVAAFRQQLIEWQGRVNEMRQSLQMGSSQLEMRQAEIEARAREVASSTARLSAEVEQLEREKKVVAERRVEMDRHLSDMREWYRKKIRELAKVDVPIDEEPGEGDVVPMPEMDSTVADSTSDEDRNPARAVLTLNDEIEPADRQLGELLASAELVDDDTLQALWAEARRQRRSLRQLLLAGGYLTLYQMALIEAGNLDGLVLGPVRVIDRFSSTPREAVYRVFDPRRNVEALLRHLAESEMEDAVHPDEFRQRFASAATVQHGNVAAVLEVLEIADRPAALLEWVNGMAACDWPPLVSAPGVLYRLLCQGALALQAVHTADLTHGHIDGNAFVLDGKGTLKLVGLGEPTWLTAQPADQADSPANDLLALGRLAGEWAALSASGKSGKSKPLPAEMQTILTRLQSEDPEHAYDSAQALIDDLEQIGSKVPSGATAWDRLLRQVREQSPPTAMRQTA